MKTDEVRSHRINYLLQFFMRTPDESKLLERATEMNIDISTARDYCNTVLVHYRKPKKENSN